MPEEITTQPQEITPSDSEVANADNPQTETTPANPEAVEAITPENTPETGDLATQTAEPEATEPVLGVIDPIVAIIDNQPESVLAEQKTENTAPNAETVVTAEKQAEPADLSTKLVADGTNEVVRGTSFIHNLLIKANEKIQWRKRQKLEKIMAFFDQQGRVDNEDVRKLLRVSDATAGRYLGMLERVGRIKREGKAGRSTSYIKL